MMEQSKSKEAQQKKLTPYLQKLEDIKKRATILDADYGKAVMKYLYKLDPNTSNVLTWDAVTENVEYMNYQIALEHPEYCKYVTTMDHLFYVWAGSEFATGIPVRLDLSAFDMSNVRSMQHAFSCINCESINFGEADLSMVTSMSDIFYGSNRLEEVDFSRCKFRDLNYFKEAFCNCSELKSLKVGKTAFSEVINMNFAFRDCRALTQVNFSGMDFHRVQNMQSLFDGCGKLEHVNMSGANLGHLLYASEMFAYCTRLVSVDMSYSDLSSLDYAASMFECCSALETLDMSNVKWGEEEIITDDMFKDCGSLQTLKIDDNTPRTELKEAWDAKVEMIRKNKNKQNKTKKKHASA